MSDFFDVEAYLQSKGLHTKRASSREVHLACIFCEEAEGKRGRLYVNVDPNSDPPGLFYCHLCGERGAINKLRKKLGDSPLRDDEAPVQSFSKLKIFAAAADYYHDLLADQPEVYAYLRDERGLSFDTIQKHKIGWADGTLHIHLKKLGFSREEMVETGLIRENGHDFLNSNITIPYFSTGNVVQIRGKQINGKYFTPPGQKARLFNADALTGAETAVITEGEFDALVVEQLGFKACGVPGATSWQDGWTSYFDSAKRVYVVFDNDAAGNAGAEKVAKAIGAKARIVKMPEAAQGEPKNDPSEWIVKKGNGREEFMKLLTATRSALLVTVDDAKLEWDEVQSSVGLKMGVEAIDARLMPGILPAQVMVVLAKTGTGKTVWTLNIFQRMLMQQPDMKILFVSLEQTRGEWFERARRIFRFYNLDATDADCLAYYRHHLLMVDKNRLTEEDLIAAIDQYEFDMGCKPDLVAVDYLGYWARAYQGEPYERTSKAVMALKAIAKEMRIAFLAPHQVSRVAKFGEEIEADASRDSGVVEETADFMLTLWNDDAKKGKTENERTGRVTAKIVKSRHGGVGTKVDFQFAPLSLAMIPVGEDPVLVDRARAEHEMALMRDPFEVAIYRHATGDSRITIPPADLDVWRKTLGL